MERRALRGQYSTGHAERQRASRSKRPLELRQVSTN